MNLYQVGFNDVVNNNVKFVVIVTFNDHSLAEDALELLSKSKEFYGAALIIKLDESVDETISWIKFQQALKSKKDRTNDEIELS